MYYRPLAFICLLRDGVKSATLLCPSGRFFDFSAGICVAAKAGGKGFVRRKKKYGVRQIIFIAYWAWSFLLYRYSAARANSLLALLRRQIFPFLQRADAQKQTALLNAFFVSPIRKISPNRRHNGAKHSFTEYYDKHNIIKTR